MMQTATSNVGIIDDEITSQAVVTAVAEETGVDPMELDPCTTSSTLTP